MLSCKQFLTELSDYLDETATLEIRARLEKHITECPNCWVICDTTRRTIQVFRGMRACEIPTDVHARLLEALDRKIRASEAAVEPEPNPKASPGGNKDLNLG